MDQSQWKDIGEFGLIESISGRFQAPEGVLGIGDDCAIIPQRDGLDTLVSTDMLVEGTHFLLEDITPYRLGWKAAAVNISDIAAMGGRPYGSFLSLALTEGVGCEWINRFLDGYKAVSDLFSCPLLGGDTTFSKHMFCANVAVLGTSSSGTSHRRRDAKAGDLICVTGTLGDSAGGLRAILEGVGRDEDVSYLIQRHYEPMPRVREGLKLAKAHAMMDISDGIGSDLRHILKASGVGAEIDTLSIPVSRQLKAVCDRYGWDVTELAISGGEDYELLFTIREEDTGSLDFPFSVIGGITEKQGLKWLGSDRDFGGYRHF